MRGGAQFLGRDFERVVVVAAEFGHAFSIDVEPDASGTGDRMPTARGSPT